MPKCAKCSHPQVAHVGPRGACASRDFPDKMVGHMRRAPHCPCESYEAPADLPPSSCYLCTGPLGSTTAYVGARAVICKFCGVAAGEWFKQMDRQDRDAARFGIHEKAAKQLRDAIAPGHPTPGEQQAAHDCRADLRCMRGCIFATPTPDDCDRVRAVAAWERDRAERLERTLRSEVHQTERLSGVVRMLKDERNTAITERDKAREAAERVAGDIARLHGQRDEYASELGKAREELRRSREAGTDLANTVIRCAGKLSDLRVAIERAIVGTEVNADPMLKALRAALVKSKS